MNLLKKGSKYLFIMCFVLIIVYPVYGYFFDQDTELNGVTYDTKISNISVDSAMDGTFQSELNSWVEGSFWGRKSLIKLRSQLLYSVFGVSPNGNVVIGKDKYLFEPEYIKREVNVYPASDDEYFADLIDKLEKVHTLCGERDKDLFVFITPNKAHFCKEKVPGKYFKMGHDGENNYDKLVRYLENSNIKYFDSHRYIEENPNIVEGPVFYSTGIHWSSPWANASALAFANYVSNNSNWNLGDIRQAVLPADGPIGADADLYNSLNLIAEPSGEQYYDSSINIENDSKRPSVFMRGGSFMGQSLAKLCQAGAFESYVQLENNYYFVYDYSKTEYMSSFSAYDEFENMFDLISDADILILEVNEAHISQMSWNFIDYILENSDKWE